ncbi:MAG: FkbM family methyltransferase [Verrucomicrobia bacterium]|nr:FkbM family methyltransferase [Verrucomicrobiota bacterium]MBU1910298.1 FkbM family methyltransferase [Verrucomicrobiota bacterium]
MMALLKKLVRRYAPPGLKHRLRKWNSWRLVRDFDESRWPPAAGVRRLIRSGDRVVDAGANIGYVTALFSRWVGPTGRVYSMEPEPGTFDVLAANVRRLNLGNVDLFPCAVSSREGEGVLAIPEYADGGENLYEARVLDQAEAGLSAGATRAKAEGGVRTVKIQLATLDRLLVRRADALALIKLDVEGCELEAVQGAAELVRRFHPVFLIEVSGNPWEPGSRAAALLDLMKAWGYRPYRLEAGEWRLIERGAASLDVLFWPSNSSPPG